ncbi:MAG: 50S ribosomal protein L4 [Candidatus Doudnabacteria bacterium]|nr:50S ribosomal protein L4 [Candidatus Doudnabacteria bacterium]
MNKVAVYNKNAEPAGEVELSPAVFQVKTSPGLIHQLVVAERANNRNTVAHSKTRGEVRGGGKKPWRQKGTGRARAGSIRSPIWKGGGVTFGPRPTRDFSQKVNRTQFKRGLLGVLTERLANSRLFVIERFELPEISTKNFVAQLKVFREKFGLAGKSLMIVTAKADRNLYRSARSVPLAQVLTLPQLSVDSLLGAEAVLIFKDSLADLERRFVK